MKNVLTNAPLAIKIIHYLGKNAHVTFTKIAKDVNRDLFNIINEYIWKPMYKEQYESPSWFDLHIALSNEEKLKIQFNRLRKSYIEVANCCNCRLYCKSCSNPVTSNVEVNISCTKCSESFTIDNIYTLFQQNIYKKELITTYCKECTIENKL